MKIKPEHLKHIESAVSALDTPQARAAYQDKGLSHMRYRWDLAHAAGLTPWFSSELYPYLNDDHIDTALRKVVQSF
jgi:hypothetical protein